MSTRLVIGCMTGTSIDAMDAAAVWVHGRGLEMRAEFVGGVSKPLGELGPQLRAMADQKAMTAGEIAFLSRDFSMAHAAAIRELAQKPALVAVHGQTVYHAPPVSWQMFNGAVLAHELGVPVVYDLRAADLAAGGQGAPITPLADWILFRGEHSTAVINLGGFCNATVLPATRASLTPADEISDVEGFDICACNHLLDRVSRDLLHRPYDDGGRCALAGKVQPSAVEDFTSVLREQSRSGRSLGTGDETGRLVAQWASRAAPNDLAASVCASIAMTIKARLSRVSQFLIAGGGARNEALVRELRTSGRAVEPTDTRGIPIEYREAAEMAILGALCADGVAITLPGVTGVRGPAPVAGVWAGR